MLRQTSLMPFVTVVFCCLAAWAQGTNLLCDPAFDASSNPGGFPNSGCWHDDHIGEAGAVLDGVDPRSLPYSLHVYTGTSASDYLSRPYHTWVTSSPGKVYHAVAYLETRAGLPWQPGSSAYIRVSFLDSGGGELAHCDSPSYQAPSTTWSLLELTTSSAPTGTSRVRYTIVLQKPDDVSGQSVVNVDDCLLEEVAAPPELTVDPRRLDFGATNSTMTLVITNMGGGSLEWNVSASDEPWITVLPPGSGTTLAGESDFVEIAASRAGLGVGSYSSTVTVTPTPGDPAEIPVSFSVPEAVPTQPSLVWVCGTRLMVQRRLPDGTLSPARAYRIMGFSWSPASVATSGSFDSRRQAFADWADLDLGMIRGAGANTVYVFLDLGLDPAVFVPILDSCYDNDLMAVITVDEDGTFNEARAEAVVHAYKSHPAVLMWGIGNEWNINLFHQHFDTVAAAAEGAESLAQAVQSWDSNHPVASLYGEINIAGQSPDTAQIVSSICPSFDLWGVNTYRGQELYSLFAEWAMISSKPMFVAEFGIDSFHTTQYYPDPIDGYRDEQEQASWNHSLWLDLKTELSADNPLRVSLGGTFFSWVDEWWKVLPAGQQDNDGFYTEWNPAALPDSFANEEYFGSVRIDNDVRVPKASYYQTEADFAATSDDILLADDFESADMAAWSWHTADGESAKGYQDEQRDNGI